MNIRGIGFTNTIIGRFIKARREESTKNTPGKLCWSFKVEQYISQKTVFVSNPILGKIKLIVKPIIRGPTNVRKAIVSDIFRTFKYPVI